MFEKRISEVSGTIQGVSGAFKECDKRFQRRLGEFQDV